MQDERRSEQRSRQERMPVRPPHPQVKSWWKRCVPAARIQWSRLSYDELLETDGDVQALTQLVRERYAVTVMEARRQVNAFLNSCGDWT